MLKEKDLVTPIGVFTVVKPFEDEKEDKDYIQLDPYEKGTEEMLAQYDANGILELDAEGKGKEFDGYSEGDFFSFKGSYPVVRTNEFFSKIQIGDVLVSIPNHKLMESDK